MSEYLKPHQVDDILDKEKEEWLWLSILRQKWPNATPRTFKSAIGVSGNVLTHIYQNHVNKKYPKWHLLVFCNFLRQYNVEDCAHAHWRMSKQPYRDVIANITACLCRMNYVNFQRIFDLNHVIWFHPQTHRRYLFVGVIDTFEAFLEKDNMSEYWIRHRYISIKKGGRATFKYEVVIHPLTGLILWFEGPFFGREHDYSICKKSGINEELEFWRNQSDDGELLLFGDLAYKGSDLIWTKHHVGTSGILGSILKRHRNSVERVIGFLRRFKIFNDLFRHDKRKHDIYTNIVVQMCQLDISINKTF